MAGRGVKADGKFQPSGISGKVTGKGHELYTRNAQWLELSVGYHTRTNHFRTLFLLFLYHHHLTFALWISSPRRVDFWRRRAGHGLLFREGGDDNSGEIYSLRSWPCDRWGYCSHVLVQCPQGLHPWGLRRDPLRGTMGWVDRIAGETVDLLEYKEKGNVSTYSDGIKVSFNLIPGDIYWSTGLSYSGMSFMSIGWNWRPPRFCIHRQQRRLTILYVNEVCTA